jgi:hypothetical protein
VSNCGIVAAVKFWLKYLTFINFTKNFNLVNALLGLLPGHWKRAMQVRGSEAYASLASW